MCCSAIVCCCATDYCCPKIPLCASDYCCNRFFSLSGFSSPKIPNPCFLSLPRISFSLFVSLPSGCMLFAGVFRDLSELSSCLPLCASFFWLPPHLSLFILALFVLFLCLLVFLCESVRLLIGNILLIKIITGLNYFPF